MASITLASIYFFPVKEIRPLHRPKTTYELPAVKRNGNPKLLVIEDQYEILETPITHQKTQRTIPAEEVARDILEKFISGAPFMNAHQHPGIFIATGIDLDYGVNKALEAQVPYANALIEEARRLFKDPTGRGSKSITKLMHAAGAWLGLEGEEWQNTVDPRAMIICPSCATSISSDAIVCPKCSGVVDIKRWAERQKQMEEAMQATRTLAPAGK